MAKERNAVEDTLFGDIVFRHGELRPSGKTRGFFDASRRESGLFMTRNVERAVSIGKKAPGASILPSRKLCPQPDHRWPLQLKRGSYTKMFERVADKCTLLVIDALNSRTPMRFSRLRERLGGFSQKDADEDTASARTRRSRGQACSRGSAAESALSINLLERVSVSPSAACGSGEAHMQHVERSRRTYDAAIPAATPWNGPALVAPNRRYTRLAIAPMKSSWSRPPPRPFSRSRYMLCTSAIAASN